MKKPEAQIKREADSLFTKWVDEASKIAKLKYGSASGAQFDRIFMAVVGKKIASVVAILDLEEES